MGNLLKTLGRHALGAVSGGLGYVLGSGAASASGSLEDQVAAAGAAVAIAFYALTEKLLKQLTVKYFGEKS
jgi:hypothetical protein